MKSVVRRPGRIVGKQPLLDDFGLARYSTGLYNGEGYAYCKTRTGGNPSATIAITMCDLDALLPVGEWWGLPVRKRGGRRKSCADGEAYRIETSGLRARLLIEAMKRNGLSARKRVQWEKVLIRSQ
jgi:hypothetical protein